MFALLRNATVIGVIAYFSPVHDMSPEERLGALRAAPAELAKEAMRAGPGLALQAVSSMDSASRDALTAKITELATGHSQNSKATNSR